MTLRLFRFVGVGVAAAAGIATYFLAKDTTFPAIAGQQIVWPWAIVVGATVLIVPYLLFAIITWLVDQIHRVKVTDLLAAVGGLFVGFLFALVLTFPLSQVQLWHLNYWLPLLSVVLFGYLGASVAVLRREEIQRSLPFVRRHNRDQQEGDEGEQDDNRRNRNAKPIVVEKEAERVLLDTSTIIDGRIAEISQTGFIMGTLVVPRFVLEELQRIADSADTLRRNRGRRGLDILNRLQKETNIPVEIVDNDFESIHEVDAKLVKLAKHYHCPIITNDFNLNKVAELQGVKVLNINELANAIKPALLPGEDMDVKIIQEGKEFGQGVGYLDDGTMIVVEGGKPHLNNEVEVTVTRVLQTAAGRMIFAHPKATGSTPAIRKTS